MTDPGVAQIEVGGDAPIALYRLYADQALLYIGITDNVGARLAEHAKSKRWWPLVTRKTLSWYGSRAEASAAEYRAITAENPIHNIRRTDPATKPQPDRHKPEDTPVTLRPPQDLRAWLLSEAARRGISRSALIIEAIREKQARDQP